MWEILETMVVVAFRPFALGSLGHSAPIEEKVFKVAKR
jgi:hypothetical protein